jgi:pyruvate dehydrogenase E2 component (dihydrolipoamide acetyltransferase)
MASEIRVPRLGWDMEEGVFLGWLKRDGEEVKAGEPLYTLEGDKSAQEIEALDAGILRIAPDGPQEGDAILVGTLLGHVESLSPSSAIRASPAPITPSPIPLSPIGNEGNKAASSPPVGERRRGERVTASPRARRAARELQVDVAQVQGTGRTGRVRERDVIAFANRTPKERVPATGQVPTSVRRTIAERMVHSLRTTAPVTLTTTVDATNLVNLRDQFKVAATPETVVPSVTDFFVKLTALALQKHPALNARWVGDQIERLSEVHIGIAVSTEGGLLVPVLRDVPRLTVRQLARQARELVGKARSRQLTPEDMRGGTFTVTNLGAFGIDAFTPIINWPECAILGVGRIHKQPAVVNQQVVSRDRVTLSLTFDHRLVDGAPAAQFLQTLSRGVENPAAWLVE